MLPTFVIGLREGLEAALIVGIIAAFLRKQGRKDLVRWVLVGVTAAALLCLAIGIVLTVVSQDLPQRQQEGMETVIGVLAIGMVTYMVVWMRRHSRELKGQLEGMASDAMDGSSRGGRAMVLMAFLAVLREGIETVVFLLAVFNFNNHHNSSSGADGKIGVVLGLALAVVLGYGIYRGGVRLNLSKFFRATGLVLVLVAAGLVVNALHTAHEAGWLNVGQGSTVDLTWLVRPGSVQSSLLTGMLGIQPTPVVIESIGWLVYLVPVGCYVAWPPGRSLARRTVSRALLSAGAVLGVAAIVLAMAAPSRPAARPVTTAGGVSSQLLAVHGTSATIATTLRNPVAGADGGRTTLTLSRTDETTHAGVVANEYQGTRPGTGAATLPTSVSYDRVAALNGGRLPIGFHSVANGTSTLRYTDVSTVTVWVEPRTGRVIDVRWQERVTADLVQPGHPSITLDEPAATATLATPAASVTAAASAAQHDLDDLDQHSLLVGLAWTLGVLALVCLLAGLVFGIAPRQRAEDDSTAPVTPEETLVNS